jgi:hypothetical protein
MQVFGYGKTNWHWPILAEGMITRPTTRASSILIEKTVTNAARSSILRTCKYNAEKASSASGARC